MAGKRGKGKKMVMKAPPIEPTPDQISAAEQDAKAETTMAGGNAPGEEEAAQENPIYLPMAGLLAITKAIHFGHGEYGNHVAIKQGETTYKVGVPIPGGGHTLYHVELPDVLPIPMTPAD